MYEDKTVDNILKDMLAQFGADVRTDEGSLAWNACAKIADALETIYEELDVIRDNLTPDTMDLDHLIELASQIGIDYKEATPAIARGVFTQEIEEGTQFACGDFTYTSGELIEGTTYNYYMICDEEGAEANTNTGDLDPLDYVEDFEGGEITEVLTLGTDDEDEEEFRDRIQDSFGAKAFGGNKADYQMFIDAIEGVGGCKPRRRASDSPWINIYLINSAYLAPSNDLITTVQNAVDPTATSGEGDGMAPICHHVQILGVSTTTLPISATLTLDDGYTVQGVKSYVEQAIGAYFSELRKNWESNDSNLTVVRIAQIEARILTVEGIVDVSNTKINNLAANAELAFNYIPLMGEVTLSV